MGLFSKKCPPPVSKRESPVGHILREKLAKASPVTLPDGLTFTFSKRLMGVEELKKEEVDIPTLEQLAIIAKHLKICDRYLEPMLVWGAREGAPVPVWVRPGHKKPCQVMRVSSTGCQAFLITVQSESSWITLAPGASQPVSAGNGTMTSISFMAKTDPGVNGGEISATANQKPLGKAGDITATPGPYSITLGEPQALPSVSIKNTGNVTVYIKDLSVS